MSDEIECNVTATGVLSADEVHAAIILYLSQRVQCPELAIIEAEAVVDEETLEYAGYEYTISYPMEDYLEHINPKGLEAVPGEEAPGDATDPQDREMDQHVGQVLGEEAPGRDEQIDGGGV